MKLDFNLQTTQRQGLALTAQVQQAIKLLHMTNFEIKEFVENAFEENPFIETKSQNADEVGEANTTGDSSINGNSSEDQVLPSPVLENKTTTENQFETGEAYVPKSMVGRQETDYDILSFIKAQKKSLYSHCLNFIQNLNLVGTESIIALKILEALEPTGWIELDLDDLVEKLSCDSDLATRTLAKLQTIEPAGIFARDLRECLLLQAKDKDLYKNSMVTVLDNLHLMANGKFDLLKRRSGCSDAELSDIFKIIKSFDPKPGLQFETYEAPIREPDLIVKAIDNKWIVELNNSNLPDVIIQKDYAKELRQKLNDKKSRDFIHSKIGEAKWLEKAIEKRNDTMIKVGSEIIKRQIGFLEGGLQNIEPMILKDIAEAVDMHESTISRVTTGSLIQTPQGTIELKAFFSVGLQQEGDNNLKSSTSIKQKIKALISNEDPNKPISDDAIVENLTSEGLILARRTVAKYRKLENIPSSFARKRRHILAGAVS